MDNYVLQADEVILYEGDVTCNIAKGNLQLVLSSQRVILEKEKGLFKKECELICDMTFDKIKIYNDEPQIKQKGNEVTIQSTEQNIILAFSGMIEARKFTGKIIDAVTGTSIAKRGSNKIKDAFNMVDDTLGLDTRGTIKGVLENGVKGTLLSGSGKKKQ